jgi:hypothetical protein
MMSYSMSADTGLHLQRPTMASLDALVEIAVTLHQVAGRPMQM